MTLQELNDYLTSRVGGIGAVTNPAFANTAATAIAGAYNHVWGSHDWKVRRSQATLTASTASNTCPADFERCRWLRCQFSGRKTSVVVMPEERFDSYHAFPSDDGTGQPVECKIVYDGVTNTWKVYWWRVPDQSYTMIMAYDRKADVTFFPNLPSHMVKAVQASALSLMMSGDQQGGNLEALASRALRDAMDADTEFSGVYPFSMKDQGWNDFDPEGVSTWPSGVGNPIHW